MAALSPEPQHPQRQTAVPSAGFAATPSAPAYVRVQRALLAVCIILAPLSITLYILTWTGNGRQAIAAAAAAGPTGNMLHFIGGVAASFFLPLGYLGMSLLGMRRAPWLATLCAALSLIGWIPWAALMGIDALAFDIVQLGVTPQREALWGRLNGDAVMTTFLLIYIVGHLLSAVLIGIMLGRLRLIPVWAAWAFALTSPLTIVIFPVHNVVFQDTVSYLICALFIIGALPAALTMLQGRGDCVLAPAAPDARSAAELIE
jgi:hypothetical protein